MLLLAFILLYFHSFDVRYVDYLRLASNREWQALLWKPGAQADELLHC